MAGPGSRGGSERPRVVEVREEAPGVYRVVVKKPDGGREVFTVAARDGVLETPFGAYPLASLARRGQRRGRRGGRIGWLVDVENGVVRARLPVRVVERLVEPDSHVSEGEAVLVVETMKMLNEVSAPCSGVLEEARGPGEAVAAGGVLLRIRCG